MLYRHENMGIFMNSGDDLLDKMININCNISHKENIKMDKNKIDDTFDNLRSSGLVCCMI